MQRIEMQRANLAKFSFGGVHCSKVKLSLSFPIVKLAKLKTGENTASIVYLECISVVKLMLLYLFVSISRFTTVVYKH